MKINLISPYFYKQQYKNKKNRYVTFESKTAFKQKSTENITNIFKELVKIPSPPLKEDKVSAWILSFCKRNKINAAQDEYKNIILNIPATDKTKQPLLFSAHMDVVGDDSPINLISDGNFIKTDGTRTLGADDKAGIAAALDLAKTITNSNAKHGGAEMIFTRDEELGMTGIQNIKFKDIESKYVIVLDEAKLGRLDNAGAGFTTVILSVTTPYGGHSGIDICDKNRVNAAKIISEILAKFPQGVFFEDNNGPVTSINFGTIIAGDIQNSATKIAEDKLILKDYLDFFITNAVTNVINTKAKAALSIRSSDRKQEYKLRKKLISVVKNFNKKYKGIADITIKFEELIPIFEKSENNLLENTYKESCKKIGLKPSIGTFPAGAETHIYANNKNKYNELFKPILLGIADIFDMHSASERINIISLQKGAELIKDMFFRFNLKQ